MNEQERKELKQEIYNMLESIPELSYDMPNGLLEDDDTTGKLINKIITKIEQAERNAVERYDKMIDAKVNAHIVDREFYTNKESVRVEALKEFGIEESKCQKID